MNEIIKAILFCIISMILSFVPLLYKNNWTILHDGQQVKLFGE
jgi:hypothetical protein